MTLSPREQQVATLLKQGKTNKEIGQALNLSPYTARTNVSKMLARFNVSTRAELAATLAVRMDTTVPATPLRTQLPTQSPSRPPSKQQTADRRAGGERRSTPRQQP